MARQCVSQEELMKAIMGEMEAKEYYELLVTKTDSPENKKIITGFIKDEEKHQAAYRALYRDLYGSIPAMPYMKEPTIDGFFAGLLGAFKDEMNAYEFYRDMSMKCTMRPKVMLPFLVAMTDENEHAQYINYMMNKENRVGQQ